MIKKTGLWILAAISLCFAQKNSTIQDSIHPTDQQWQNEFYYDYFQINVKPGDLQIIISSHELDICFFQSQNQHKYSQECVDPGYGPLYVDKKIAKAQLFQFGVKAMFPENYGAYEIEINGNLQSDIEPVKTVQSDNANPDFVLKDYLAADTTFLYAHAVQPGHCFIIDIVSADFNPMAVIHTPDGRTVKSESMSTGHAQAILKVNRAGNISITIDSQDKGSGQFYIQALAPAQYNPPPEKWLRPEL